MKSHLLFLALLPILICMVSCNEDPPIDSIQIDTTPYSFDSGPFPQPELPADNSLTEAKVHLGRMLFHDSILSEGEIQACADCHLQEDAFDDIRQFSLGVNELPGGRNAMSIVNMAWNTNGFFWDGRAATLREQSLLPIQDPLEMNETLEDVVTKVQNESVYRDQFSRSFGSSVVSAEKISLALEQFMLTIVSYNSKYDRVIAGQESFTSSEARGFDLFFTEYNASFPDASGADCAHCHGGFNLENDRYMNNGLDSGNFNDLGRFLVTGSNEDRGKFKVPTLRNIALTAPYMHDGRISTLEEVIDHYNEGIQISNTLNPALLATTYTGLLLTDQDKIDLVNFLHTLTDETLADNPEYSSPF